VMIVLHRNMIGLTFFRLGSSHYYPKHKNLHSRRIIGKKTAAYIESHT
jgi:hypothetical protein